jgi:uncharacterized protein (TIGR00290 family)
MISDATVHGPKEKVLFCWSGGKDSAMALHALADDDRYEVVALLTTVTAEYDRVSMHGIRRELLETQARAIGLPLSLVRIHIGADNAAYEQAMSEALDGFKGDGVTAVAFGDIFLEDLRLYREDKLAAVSLRAIFPIWKQPTDELARSFIARGFQAVLTCVDTEKCDGQFAGRRYDADLLNELPDGVDPCGEYGEFHSFVHAGPIFSRPIAHRLGEIVLRDNRFNFCDVLPG